MLSIYIYVILEILKQMTNKVKKLEKLIDNFLD